MTLSASLRFVFHCWLLKLSQCTGLLLWLLRTSDLCRFSFEIVQSCGLLGDVCFLCHPPSPHITLSLGYLLWALGCDPTHRAPATTVPPCAAWLSFPGAAAMLPGCLAASTHCLSTAVVASRNGQLLFLGKNLILCDLAALVAKSLVPT